VEYRNNMKRLTSADEEGDHGAATEEAIVDG